MSRDDEVEINRTNLSPQPGATPEVSSADDAETAREVTEIRVEIEQTRAEMSDTIDEIQARFSPAHIKEQVKEQVLEQYEQAKETVREATLGKVEDIMEHVSDTVYETRKSLVTTIKANPIPAALVGVGLVWLFMSGRSASKRSTNYYDDDYRRYDEEPLAYAGSATYGSAQQRGVGKWGRTSDQTGGTARGAGEAMSGMAGQVQQTASDLVDKTKSTVSGAVSRTQETAGYLADQAQQQARRAGNRAQTAMRDTPLAVGAIALAVGAGVGLAIPQTQKENEWMGQTRDTLMDKAQTAAKGTLDQVQQVAERVTEELGEPDKQPGAAKQGDRGRGTGV